MGPSHSRRVLVVDDNEELAENIAEILAIEGHSVTVVTSAEQALPIARSRDLDVVVTDYRLPGINGAQLLKALSDRGETVQAIVISAYADDRTLDEVSRVGATFIPKPLDFALLSQTVGEGADYRA